MSGQVIYLMLPINFDDMSETDLCARIFKSPGCATQGAVMGISTPRRFYAASEMLDDRRVARQAFAEIGAAEEERAVFIGDE